MSSVRIFNFHQTHKSAECSSYISIKLPRLALVAQLDVRPTGDRGIAGTTFAKVGNILYWRLIRKYFLQSFSPFR